LKSAKQTSQAVSRIKFELRVARGYDFAQGGERPAPKSRGGDFGELSRAVYPRPFAKPATHLKGRVMMRGNIHYAITLIELLMEDKQKSKIQFIWGILLLMAGVGVFFRIPQIMPEIKKIEHFAPYIGFIYFCFYLSGILLIVGGGKKVYNYLKSRN
jgi:hypothetical protein